MDYFLITFAILSITNWSILRSFLRTRLKTIEVVNNQINEDLIQKVISSITNGLNPRIVLSNIAKENNLKELAKVSTTGDDLVNAIRKDTNNDLTSVSFAQVWQVCERNGASLSPVLTSFNNQIRTENELRQELSSSLSGVKLSAYVLAFLPVIGIILAYLLGVNSISWLTNSSFGKTSLLLALILEIIGVFWVRRLINQVESIL